MSQCERCGDFADDGQHGSNYVCSECFDTPEHRRLTDDAIQRAGKKLQELSDPPLPAHN